MAISFPKGIAKLPVSLTQANFTLRDSVAAAESEIAVYQVPRNMSLAFRAGNRFYIRIRTSVPATITTGTLRMYIADANKASKFKVIEAPPTALYAGDGGQNVSNREMMFLLRAGFSRASDEWIIITYEGAPVADDAQTEIILEGTQFIKV